MGSLIARAAIELHHASGVERLIQIFPPNHGCVLAEIAEPLDAAMVARNQFLRILSSFSEGSEPTIGKAVAPAAVLSWMSDGFALASRDLCPNSEFLRSLNQLPRAASVDYTILTGTGGPLPPLVGAAILLSGPALLEQVQVDIDQTKIQTAWTWFEKLVRDGQLIRGQGDGVVSVASTYLDGVRDIVKLDCNHIAWSDLDSESGRRVIAEVLARLN